MPHLDDGFIHELLDGEVPSAQLGPIQQHLASCAECRGRLDVERRLRDDVDGLIDVLEVPAVITPRVVTPPAAGRSTRWARDLAWAATVVLAIGLGYAARGGPSAPIPLIAPAKDDTVVSPSANSVADAQTNTKVDQPVAKARNAPAPPPAPKSAAPTMKPPARSNVGALSADAADRRPDAVAQKGSSEVNAAAAPPVQMMRRAGGGRGGSGGGRAGQGASALTAREVAPLPIDTISLPDAMRRLGGSIRLIDGLVPERLESQGSYVRVVYNGGFVLKQQLVDGKIVFDVLGPSGVATDSLARLRARVRE